MRTNGLYARTFCLGIVASFGVAAFAGCSSAPSPQAPGVVAITSPKEEPVCDCSDSSCYPDYQTYEDDCGGGGGGGGGCVSNGCGDQCGTITDNCGDTLDCGACSTTVCCNQICPDGSTLYCESMNNSCAMCANYMAAHNNCTCPQPSCSSPMQPSNGVCTCPSGTQMAGSTSACTSSSQSGASVSDSFCGTSGPCGPGGGCVPGTCTTYTVISCNDACSYSVSNLYQCKACP
jgi:hypothetical protein